MASSRGGRIQSGWGNNRRKPQFNPAVHSPAESLYQPEHSISEFRTKPSEIVINQSGEKTISEDPSGISRITFYPEFMSVEDADSAFATLETELQWRQNSDKYGPQPRLTVWIGAHPYSYSGLVHQPMNQWHPVLEDIRKRVEIVTGRTFNSVLCNLYRDNHDSVDWHCDDEPSLGHNPYIASVSLGDTRVFELRKKPASGEPEDFSLSQQVKINAVHGSLIIMEGSTQDDWQHRLRKEYHDRKPRINLTFRTIYGD